MQKSGLIAALGTLLLSAVPMDDQVVGDLSGAEDLYTKSGLLVPPAAGQAQIVFYRTSSIRGAVMGCKIFANARIMAKLGGGQYLVHNVAPGAHIFSSAKSGRGTLEVTTVAGQRRFVKCDFGNGIMARHAMLVLADQNSFAEKAKDLNERPGRNDRSDQEQGGSNN